MAHVSLKNVDIEFPVIDSRSRSFRSGLIQMSGGNFRQKESGSQVVQALSKINLDLKDGDRLALVGHNGAGKSTLLRTISGVYPPIGGFISVDGRLQSLLDITMGMDFELNGHENIVLRGICMGLTFAEIKELAPAIEEFAAIGDFINLPLRSYSSGMVLRLAFAIVTSVTPDIIVMDELISVGDENFSQKAKARLKHMLSDSGILVLASHNERVLNEYCNRAILLRKGEIVFEGSVEAVSAAYKEANYR